MAKSQRFAIGNHSLSIYLESFSNKWKLYIYIWQQFLLEFKVLYLQYRILHLFNFIQNLYFYGFQVDTISLSSLVRLIEIGACDMQHVASICKPS